VQHGQKPLDDDVESLLDAIASLAKLPSDIQDLVDPDLRSLSLDQNGCRRT
jgi:hypothetical protein